MDLNFDLMINKSKEVLFKSDLMTKFPSKKERQLMEQFISDAVMLAVIIAANPQSAKKYETDRKMIEARLYGLRTLAEAKVEHALLEMVKAAIPDSVPKQLVESVVLFFG
jgi:hypothetical protein